MTVSLSSVALVVRLKSTVLPSSAARGSAYSTTARISARFDSGSPPKNTRLMRLRSLACFSSSSTDLTAVGKSMRSPWSGALKSSL